VVGPASATDNAAARFDTTTGKLIQNSALIIADTTGSLSRSGGGGIPLEGTNTNDSASAGYVGEIVESTVLLGSAVTLTTAVANNVTSISLTAGDWDVWGNVGYNPGGTITRLACWISTTSATYPTAPNAGALADWRAGFTSGAGQLIPAGMRRISISATTTTYLSVYAEFGTSMTAYGYIGARRVR
jgi:hypothetical protein